MERASRRTTVTSVLACAVSLGVAMATTWFPQEVFCPVCSTKNDFQVIGSYGGYIYDWPEKYQYVFWPFTDGSSLYSCRKCRFTTFMADFGSVPADKLPPLRRTLQEAPASGEHASYTDVPILERLDLARRCYEVLGQDDDAWCHFERVVGYHAEVHEDQKLARQARTRALELARKLAAAPTNAPRKKELLIIAASMRHHLGDDTAALEDLKAAQKLRYTYSAHPDTTPEDVGNIDTYLSKLTSEYISKLERGPRAK